MQKRNKLLRRLTGTKWGADRSLLRQLHEGCGQAAADFALGVYGNFASESAMSRLEGEQRRAACAISGCTSTTPTHAALHEAELLPMAQRSRQHAAIMLERFRRLPKHMQAASLIDPPAHPTRVSWGGKKTGEEEGVRGCWRSTARQVAEQAGTLHSTPEQLLIAPLRAPWEWTATTSIQPNLVRPVSKSKNSRAECREAALETVARLPGPFAALLSTDGSAVDGVRRGGSGWYICTPAGKALLRGCCAAGRLSSSYRSEGIAMREGLRDLQRAL
eukprot:gene9538-8431_t